MKAENSAKASGTVSRSGDRTGNEDQSVALFQKVKKVVELWSVQTVDGQCHFFPREQ